jgi:hypothetical protein
MSFAANIISCPVIKNMTNEMVLPVCQISSPIYDFITYLTQEIVQKLSLPLLL